MIVGEAHHGCTNTSACPKCRFAISQAGTRYALPGGRSVPFGIFQIMSGIFKTMYLKLNTKLMIIH